MLSTQRPLQVPSRQRAISMLPLVLPLLLGLLSTRMPVHVSAQAEGLTDNTTSTSPAAGEDEIDFLLDLEAQNATNNTIISETPAEDDPPVVEEADHTILFETTTDSGAVIRQTPTLTSILQLYELRFTLDGVTGNGAITNRTQVQEFRWFQQNLTYDFVPDLVPDITTIDQVRTRCVYLRQSSSDEKPTDWQTRSRSSSAMTTRQQQQQQQPTRQRDDDPNDGDAILTANTTYIYTYTMNYSSPSVTIDNYTLFYEQTLPTQWEALTTLMRDILKVAASDVLVIQGLFPIPIPLTTTNPTVEPTLVPTVAPSVTAVPSQSLVPTAYPTFAVNSTSRGRFDLVFVVHDITDPASMFLDKDVFCHILIGITPGFKPPQHNLEQIDISCPVITRGFAPLLVTLPPRPAVDLSEFLPAPNPDDDLERNTTTTTTEALEGNSTTEDTNMTMMDTTEARFLRRRLQEDAANTTTAEEDQPNSSPDNNTTSGFPIIGTNTTYDTPINVLFTFSIVMRYESAVLDVSEYPSLLDIFVNENIDQMGDYLEQEFNLTVSNNLTIRSFFQVFENTRAPTFVPTLAPSDTPSESTSLEPTFFPTVSSQPSQVIPSENGTDIAPVPPTTNAPTTERGTDVPVVPPPSTSDDTVVIVVVSLVVVIAVGVMLALFILYLKRKANLEREMDSQRRASTAATTTTTTPFPDKDDTLVNKKMSHGTEDTIKSVAWERDPTASALVAVTPLKDHVVENTFHEEVAEEKSTKTVSSSPQSEDSPSSGKSEEVTLRASGLLAEIAENAYDDDDDDDDDDYPGGRGRLNTETSLFGEFEQYKDKNLEQMRAKVENNVTGMDDMMSQAMIAALMTDQSSAPSWHGAKTGVEIEANALWDVTEFLRRHNPASTGDR